MRNAAAILLCPLLLALASCRGDEAPTNNSRPTSGTASGAAPGDPARLDAEISRLERQTERNPADDEARAQLARAYIRRADTHLGHQRLPEALADYRRAQRLDPDNEEAQKKVYDLAPQVEGTPQEGEYGEPAPPPISPNVEGEGKETPEKK